MQTIRTQPEQTIKWQPRAGMPAVVCSLSLNMSPDFLGGKLGRRTASFINSRQIRQ